MLNKEEVYFKTVYFYILSINEVHLHTVLHLYSSQSINEVYFNCTFFWEVNTKYTQSILHFCKGIMPSLS